MISGPLRQPGTRGPGRGRRRRSSTSVGEGGWAAVPDDQPIRIDDGVVYADEAAVAHGRVVELARPARRDGAGPLRSGRPAGHPDPQRRASSCAASRTCCSTAAGSPTSRPRSPGGPPWSSRASSTASWCPCVASCASRTPRSSRSAGAADDLMDFGWVADVVVAAVKEPGGLPVGGRAQAAADVVLVCTHGAGRRGGRDGRRASSGSASSRTLVESSATPEDLALLLADRHDAVPLVGVGLQRPPRGLPRPPAGGPGQHLRHPAQGRLAAGRRQRRPLPAHQWRDRPRQVVALLLAGIVAVGVAVAVTPAGQELFDALGDQLGSLL